MVHQHIFFVFQCHLTAIWWCINQFLTSRQIKVHSNAQILNLVSESICQSVVPQRARLPAQQYLDLSLEVLNSIYLGGWVSFSLKLPSCSDAKLNYTSSLRGQLNRASKLRCNLPLHSIAKLNTGIMIRFKSHLASFTDDTWLQGSGTTTIPCRLVSNSHIDGVFHTEHKQYKPTHQSVELKKATSI